MGQAGVIRRIVPRHVQGEAIAIEVLLDVLDVAAVLAGVWLHAGSQRQGPLRRLEGSLRFQEMLFFRNCMPRKRMGIFGRPVE